MLVSIAMATYNGARYLREQLDSILCQSVDDFELIICDDCSTDDTWDILQEYEQKDSRIHCFRNDKNLGFVKNFEKTFTLCRGEYIACSDQDDVWLDNHLQILLHSIKDYDLVCGNAYLTDENLVKSDSTLLDLLNIDFFPVTKNEWFFFLLHNSIFQGAALLFRRTLLKSALPFPANICFHDYWLALHAASQNGVAYVIDSILYYRRHNNTVTKINRASLRHIRNTSILYNKRQISILSELKKSVFSKTGKTQIDSAIKYYSKGNKIFKIKYFIKNYKSIYLSNKPFPFCLRLLKKILVEC